MSLENERRFYIDFNTIRICYPSEVSKKVKNFGVLEQYKDKKYTIRQSFLSERIAPTLQRVVQ